MLGTAEDGVIEVCQIRMLSKFDNDIGRATKPCKVLISRDISFGGWLNLSAQIR